MCLKNVNLLCFCRAFCSLLFCFRFLQINFNIVLIILSCCICSPLPVVPFLLLFALCSLAFLSANRNEGFSLFAVKHFSIRRRNKKKVIFNLTTKFSSHFFRRVCQFVCQSALREMQKWFLLKVYFLIWLARFTFLLFHCCCCCCLRFPTVAVVVAGLIKI